MKKRAKIVIIIVQTYSDNDLLLKVRFKDFSDKINQLMTHENLRSMQQILKVRISYFREYFKGNLLVGQNSKVGKVDSNDKRSP